MALSASFNHISIIMWRSDLLLGETGVPGKHHVTCEYYYIPEGQT
jgi:hypothetical protein